MSTPESNEDFAKHAAAAMRIKVKTESLNRAILEAVAQGLRVQAALVDHATVEGEMPVLHIEVLRPL